MEECKKCAGDGWVYQQRNGENGLIKPCPDCTEESVRTLDANDPEIQAVFFSLKEKEDELKRFQNTPIENIFVGGVFPENIIPKEKDLEEIWDLAIERYGDDPTHYGDQKDGFVEGYLEAQKAFYKNK